MLWGDVRSLLGKNRNGKSIGCKNKYIRFNHDFKFVEKMNKPGFAYENYYDIFEFDFKEIYDSANFKLTEEESFLVHYAEVISTFPYLLVYPKRTLKQKSIKK